MPNWVIFSSVFSIPNRQNISLKICLPINESLISLCSKNINDPCDYRVKKVEEFFEAHKNYVENIKKQYFYYFNDSKKNIQNLNQNVEQNQQNLLKPLEINVLSNSNSNVLNIQPTYPLFKQINIENANSQKHFIPNNLDSLNISNQNQNIISNFGNLQNGINNPISFLNPNGVNNYSNLGVLGLGYKGNLENLGNNNQMNLPSFRLNENTTNSTSNNFLNYSNNKNVQFKNDVEFEMYNKMSKEELINIILNLKRK